MPKKYIPWNFNQEEFDPELSQIKKFEGFVYIIKFIESGKFYVGKKSFWSRRKQGSGKRKTFESDWRSYAGSSIDIKNYIKNNPQDTYMKNIISMHTHPGDMTYWEAFWQFKFDVLRNENSFNENILGKFFRQRFDLINERVEFSLEFKLT